MAHLGLMLEEMYQVHQEMEATQTLIMPLLYIMLILVVEVEAIITAQDVFMSLIYQENQELLHQ